MRNRKIKKSLNQGKFFKILPIALLFRRKILLGVFLFVSLFLLILRLQIFSVKEVDIENTKAGCINSDQLKSSIDLPGQNFFTLNQKRLEKDLKEKFPCIKEINLSRTFPGKVKIQAEGRQPAAILVGLKEKWASASSLIENTATPSAENSSDSFLTDSEGIVFSKTPANLSIPKIYIFDPDIGVGKRMDNNYLSEALKILEKLKTLGINAAEGWIVEEFFVVSPDTLDLKIIFRFGDYIDAELASLQLILAEAKIKSMELKTIDLRFDKPVVKIVPQKKM